jgi:hypothetical protein
MNVVATNLAVTNQATMPQITATQAADNLIGVSQMLKNQAIAHLGAAYQATVKMTVSMTLAAKMVGTAAKTGTTNKVKTPHMRTAIIRAAKTAIHHELG